MYKTKTKTKTENKKQKPKKQRTIDQSKGNGRWQMTC
jgi:hypothetical protein